MGVFNVENKVWTILNKLTDLFLLCVLRFLFSLPLITAGAAAAGCFNGMIKIAENTDSGVWKDFISGFKASFRPATKIWLIQVLVFGLLALNAYVSFRTGSVIGVFIMALNLLLLLLAVMASFFAYPIVSRYDFSVKKVLHDAAVTAVTHLPYSLSLLVLLAAAIYLSLKVRYAFVLAFPLLEYQMARTAIWIFNRYSASETDET